MIMHEMLRYRCSVLPRAAAALLLFVTACGGHPPDSEQMAGMHAGIQHDTPAAATASTGSLYVLDQSWTDQTGNVVHLADLAGRPRVVAMAYTSCVYACPRIIAEMKRIEAALADVDPARAPGFVLFSIDPARDTPARLAEFAAEAGLDPVRWTLLTAPDDEVLELSVLLGVKYRATESGDFAHSNLVTVLDGEGAVRARVEGLDVGVAPAVEALRVLVEPQGAGA